LDNTDASPIKNLIIVI